MNDSAKESIRIRAAQAPDATGIARVRVTSWQAAYRGLIAQETLEQLSVEETSQWVEAAIRRNAPGRCSLVAQEPAGQIVGFALGGPERSQDPAYSGELYALYLLPEYVGIGIGKRLLLSMADCLLQKGMFSMLIWVLAQNPARKFYEALGGIYLREQLITIGQESLLEVAYGWKDLAGLIERFKGENNAA